MKILHVNLSKSYRGGEYQTIELIKELKTNGIDQELICRNNTRLIAEAKSIGGIKVTEVIGPFNGHLERCKDKSQNTVIHAHDGRGVYWAWLEHLIRRTPYLITRRVINSIGTSWATSKAYKGANMLIAVSFFAADILEQAIKRKTKVIYDCCRKMNHNENVNSNSPVSVSNGYPIIGHVGAFDDAVKGQSILIEAFLLLLNEYPNAKLYLIGEGKDQKLFQEKYKFQKEITFVGAVDNVFDWLSTFDLFCFPSRVEALGSSVLEAMSLGVPVVVSNAGGLPELVGLDERGLVVKTSSAMSWAGAMRQALSNQSETIARAEKGKQFVEGLSAKIMAEKYMTCYREIISCEAS